MENKWIELPGPLQSPEWTSSWVIAQIFQVEFKFVRGDGGWEPWAWSRRSAVIDIPPAYWPIRVATPPRPPDGPTGMIRTPFSILIYGINQEKIWMLE